MIGSVRGTVAYQAAEYCLIETEGGTGYRVFMPVPQMRTLSLGQEVRILTYTAVREDAIHLYGFLTQQHYDLFTLLLGVSGIGPKVAIGILGAVRPEDFYLAVQSRDLKMLTNLPGIGKKTAEHMVLELKDKIGTLKGEENDRDHDHQNDRDDQRRDAAFPNDDVLKPAHSSSPPPTSTQKPL